MSGCFFKIYWGCLFGVYTMYMYVCTCVCVFMGGERGVMFCVHLLLYTIYILTFVD